VDLGARGWQRLRVVMLPLTPLVPRPVRRSSETCARPAGATTTLTLVKPNSQRSLESGEAAALEDPKRERITRAQDAPPDLLVIQPVRDWSCAECQGTGDLLIMDEPGPLCLACADLDHLVFLPAGDTALTRRAKKASGLSAVVVRWSRTRKRYERQGLLVEEMALEQAEQQCLADEEARMRRRERDRERRAAEDVDLAASTASEIRRLFPRCPAGRAEAIARHTSLRGSGRVGRSAAGRSLDEEAITLAVVASARHEDTEYDSLLMSGVNREDARDRIRPAVDRILAAWAQPV